MKPFILELWFQKRVTVVLYLNGFSLHEVQWHGKNTLHALHVNYFHVASIGSLSNVSSPLL